MIRSILKDVSVSSYKTFKERLSDNGVILSERGQTFSYAFLDANNKQRRARETRLGSNFGRETILHELENRARQNEFRAVEQREPTINRFIDTIKQFAGRVPELTQRVTRKLKQTKEKILDDFETRFKETDCSSFILISLFLFLDDFDLWFWIFEKNKKRRSLLYIYLIYFNLLFFCVIKNSVFIGFHRIIAVQKTVYIGTKNCV